MMKGSFAHLLFAGILLTACSTLSTPIQDSPQPATIPATQMVSPLVTSTPTPMGTWETVIEGAVYSSTEPGKPIAGASVSYNISSYFLELQAGKPNKTTTDQAGKFALPVTVHDTGSIRILVEAQGYMSHEEKLVGVDLLGGGYFEIGLTPDKP